MSSSGSWINQGILAVLTILICVTIHLPFLPTDLIASGDMARLINDSAMAAWLGGYQFIDYTLYSSPLYNEFFRVLFASQWLSLENAPTFSAYLSVIASGVTSAAVLLYVWRLTSSGAVALICVALLQLIPIYWISSVYAFPSMVSLAFLMVSILVFDYAVAQRWRRSSGWLCALAALLLLAATLTKVDAVLAMPIYCLSIWRSERESRPKLFWTIALAFAGGLTLQFFDAYARALTPELAPLGGFDRAFPMTLANLVKQATFDLSVRTLGLGILVAGPIAVLLAFRRQKTAIFWLIAGAMPLFLFWGLRPPNQARHWLIPAVFFAILIVLPLTDSKAWRNRAWAAVLVAALAVSYFYHTPTKGTAFPSSRLIESTPLIQAELKQFRDIGCYVVTSERKSISVITARWKTPYLKFEILRSAQPESIRREKIGRFARYTINGHKEYWVWDYNNPPTEEELQPIRGRRQLTIVDDEWLADRDNIIPQFVDTLSISSALATPPSCYDSSNNYANPNGADKRHIAQVDPEH